MIEVEREELKDKISAMNAEEMKLVAQVLPDNILWGEIHARYNRNIVKISIIENTLGGLDE